MRALLLDIVTGESQSIATLTQAAPSHDSYFAAAAEAVR
jgi:hypothetical protein